MAEVAVEVCAQRAREAAIDRRQDPAPLVPGVDAFLQTDPDG